MFFRTREDVVEDHIVPAMVALSCDTVKFTDNITPNRMNACQVYSCMLMARQKGLVFYTRNHLDNTCKRRVLTSSVGTHGRFTRPQTAYMSKTTNMVLCCASREISRIFNLKTT